MILILSQPGDLHTEMVADCLQQKGAPYIIFHPEELGTTASLSLLYGDHIAASEIKGSTGSISLDQITSVWYRRPRIPRGTPTLGNEDREFACAEMRQSLEGLWHLLSDRFWVNPYVPDKIAHYKALQLQLAYEVGFDVPRSIITNNPHDAARFVTECGGHVIYKTLSGYIRSSGDAPTGWGIYTSRVHLDDMSQRLEEIRYAPCLFQEQLAKTSEYRLTVIGSRLFAVELHTNSVAQGEVDWRRCGPQRLLRDIPHRSIQLPIEIEKKVHSYMSRLGLFFGCFDFIHTPDDRIVFLEINPNGQWGWIEHVTGLPLVDHFSELLIQRNVQYQCAGTYHSVLPEKGNNSCDTHA